MVEGIKDVLGFPRESPIGPRIAFAGQGPDRVCRPFYVREQVQAALVRPAVPGQNVGRLKREVIVERLARAGEQVFKDPAHREHGWAGVNTATIDRDLAYLASGCRVPFEDADRVAVRRQSERGRQPAHAGADHDNVAGTSAH